MSGLSAQLTWKGVAILQGPTAQPFGSLVTNDADLVIGAASPDARLGGRHQSHRDAPDGLRTTVMRALRAPKGRSVFHGHQAEAHWRVQEARPVREGEAGGEAGEAGPAESGPQRLGSEVAL